MNYPRLSGYSVILVFALVACVSMTVPAIAQMTSVGVDCSQINQYHLLVQENLRALKALVECGIVKGGGSPSGREMKEDYPAPPNVLVSNRSCTSQATCTKSENMVWSSPDGQTIVVNYNDLSATTNTGTSYSTNGGATFTEILPPPFENGHGFNVGDPVVVFNQKLNKWFAGDLVTGCGGQGTGLWTSTDGINWTVGACAHNGAFDDRESMWVDGDPTSAAYGRMYISYNDYTVSCGLGGCLFVTYSDDGTTWSTPIQLNSGTFLRDVQITGGQISPTTAKSSLRGYQPVFIATMDEGGGGSNTRQNVMYRSMNGGSSWTSVTMGPRFKPVGDLLCSSGYFYAVAPFIRHMGWGEPAVGPNNVVHYVYAGAGTNNDHGDIFYQRSTDNGTTWSTPIQLNTDPDQQYHTQWMPSLSINPGGKLTAAWYDRRQASTPCNMLTDVGCNYNRYARQSPDNGANWQTDFVVSSSPTPQPSDELDGACYAGDYDYNSARGSTAFITWTDGRRSVNGVPVQDVNFAAVPEQ